MGLVFPFALHHRRLDPWHRPFAVVVLPGSRLAVGSPGVSPARGQKAWRCRGPAVAGGRSDPCWLSGLPARCWAAGIGRTVGRGPPPVTLSLFIGSPGSQAPALSLVPLSGEALGLSGRTHTSSVPGPRASLGTCPWKLLCSGEQWPGAAVAGKVLGSGCRVQSRFSFTALLHFPCHAPFLTGAFHKDVSALSWARVQFFA